MYYETKGEGEGSQRSGQSPTTREPKSQDPRLGSTKYPKGTTKYQVFQMIVVTYLGYYAVWYGSNPGTKKNTNTIFRNIRYKN